MTDRKKIVIIEDEPDFLRIYTDLLLTKGFQVEGLADGSQGLKRVMELIPDLVLLDLVLPGMMGMEILQKLKQNEATKNIPVIIFSVMDNSQEVEQAMSLGAYGYLVKGYAKPSEILTKIQAAIEGRQRNDETITYNLSLDTNEAELVRVASELSLGEKLVCNQCTTLLKLRLMADRTRSEGHWYAAHFVCPQCQKEF